MVRKDIWREFNVGFYNKCKRYITGHRKLDFHYLFGVYLLDKQPLVQLDEKHSVLVNTIQCWFRTIHSTRIRSKDKDVVVLMDTTYWGQISA